MSTGFPLDPLSNDMEYVEPYTEKYFAQYIDHFNFAGLDGKISTYMQRYLVSGKILSLSYFKNCTTIMLQLSAPLNKRPL